MDQIDAIVTISQWDDECRIIYTDRPIENIVEKDLYMCIENVCFPYDFFSVIHITDSESVDDVKAFYLIE